LKFGELIEKNDNFKYVGYINKDGQREGVGMVVSSKNIKDSTSTYGEYHLDKMNGCGITKDGNKILDYWG
jgi:hypothetical protein